MIKKLKNYIYRKLIAKKIHLLKMERIDISCNLPDMINNPKIYKQSRKAIKKITEEIQKLESIRLI